MTVSPKEDIEWRSFKRLTIVGLIGLFVILFLARIYRPILVSLVMSGIVAYIFDPLISWLADRLSLRRKVLVGMLIGVVAFTVSITAFFIFPIIYDEVIDIFSRLPEALSYLERSLTPLLLWVKKTKIISDETIESGFRRLNLLEGAVPTRASVLDIFSQTSFIIDMVFNILMFPLFTYMLLGEREKVFGAVTRWIPADVSPIIGIFAQKVDRVLRAVVKGQFLVALVLSVFYMAGFSLIGVPSGLAIGAVAGVCRIIPYLDVLVALILCGIVVLSSGLGGAMFVAVMGVIAVVQSIDGVIVTPRIIGDRAGLHPIVVIASVYCFGTLMGVLGILLAVPIVATFVVAAQTCWPYVMHAPFYQIGTDDLKISDQKAAPEAKQSIQN